MFHKDNVDKFQLTEQKQASILQASLTLLFAQGALIAAMMNYVFD
jgi:hypothetical protein